MLFKKKQINIEERLIAVNLRINELNQRVESKEKDLAEAKTNLSAKLGDLALSETEENRQALSHARKAFERTQQAFDEIKLQLGFLTSEREKMEIENLKAIIREAPMKAEETAQRFNDLLKQVLEILTPLSTLHSELLKEQTAFQNIIQERQRAMATLGIAEALELKVGLGELSQEGAPWGYSVQIPSLEYLDRMVAELIFYKKKKAGFEGFKKTNPDWDKKRPQSNGDRGGIGEIGPPGNSFVAGQTFDVRDYQ